MSSMVEQLALLLAAEDLGDVRAGILPAKPDNVITIRALAGLPPLRTHGPDSYARPRAQVFIRATNYLVAESRATVAWQRMFQKNVSLDGRRYLSIEPIDSPMDMGQDDQQPPRRIFSFNIQIVMEA